MLITAVTLGELSFGPHTTDDPVKRAGRVAALQHASVRASGREPRKRASDLMIAATAAGNALPLYTANPDDFKGAEAFVELIGLRACPNNCEL
jgi:predicted nucleic acid-binding protein